MFYAGAPFVAKGYAFRNYGYDDALRSVDSFLGSYGMLEVSSVTTAGKAEGGPK
jgi:4-hydroxyphenylacetate 3-monooxygenase